MPADAHAGSELLGEQERIAIRRDQDGRTQSDPLGHRPDPSECGDRFIHRNAETLGERLRIYDVIAHPDRIEADRLGPDTSGPK